MSLLSHSVGQQMMLIHHTLADRQKYRQAESHTHMIIRAFMAGGQHTRICAQT